MTLPKPARSLVKLAIRLDTACESSFIYVEENSNEYN